MLVTAMILLAALSPDTADRSGPLVTCTAPASSNRWVVVRDHRKALAFIDEVHKNMELSEGGPLDCGLQLLARCVPDLDGDGLAEIVVRARWGKRYSDDPDDTEDKALVRCHAPTFIGPSAGYSSLFIILSKQKSTWPGTVRLLEDETGSGREGPTKVAVTRWHGRPALKLHLEFTYSNTGKTALSSKVLLVEHGALVTVQVRNEVTGE